ncbi:uncharacterized protein LOC142325387 isoform X2 [Lycorma delicatula]|uniref:uncharacterized protein LOC142325387 isoform X2 n=1 Tax=Lycorma delicatula TaxID=130591 RepID=UPI003F50D5B2
MRCFRDPRPRLTYKKKEQPIFGVSLPLALERSRCHDGVEIPLVVRDCIMHIQENGLLLEGLYKISGIKSKVQHVRRSYNQREPVSLSDYDLPVATSLLKLFFRELPESLLTSKLSSKFEEASGIRDVAARGIELKSLIQQLPYCNIQLLSWVIKHLECVAAHEKQNKMSSQSLSQVLSQPLQMSQRLLLALIYHSDILFSDTKLTKYIPPLTSTSGTLPETADEITKELCKQESLLGQIHSEMNAGFVTKQREELLWEVQRMITQLKRKLRSLEKEAGEAHHATSQHYGGGSTGSTGGSTADDTTVTDNYATNVNVEHQSHNNTNIEKIAPNTTVSNLTTGAPVNNGGTRHVVEAVIESNMSDVNKNDSSPLNINITDSKSMENNDTSAVNSQEKLSLDELSLTLQTEELLALVAQLQNQIQQEQADIANLRSQIRSLGGSPSFCDYLLESCSKDTNTTVLQTVNEKDVNFSNSGVGDESNVTTSLLRQVKAESHMLQMQKKSLTDSIIEEQESVTKLRVQVKLLSLNASSFNTNNTASINVTSNSNNTLAISSPPTDDVSNVTSATIGHTQPCLAR